MRPDRSPSIEALIARLRDARALDSLVGRSPKFLAAITPIPAVAKSEATVLISGETGTGKELVAHAVHYLSHRAAQPFSPLNCGSLPDALLEDELFGHEPGAFTDARGRREGLLMEAHKGTVFLDEVDSLTPRAQVALLRLLQDRTFRALGSSRQIQAEVRFLAATNAPLKELVNTGSFRIDLYYRLSVVTIHLPPLRERREDIPLLADHFIEKHTPSGQRAPKLSAEALSALMALDWPGNIRELENVVHRGVLLSEGETIRLEDLALSPQEETPTDIGPLGGESYQGQKRQVIAQFERNYLTQLMTRYRGNVSQAARAAGKERRELGRLLKKHQMDRASFLG
jgi:DNA-binding NtrC family response regulator